jgi:hypothetical protein
MMGPTNNKHTMKKKLLFIGLDVHAKNIIIPLTGVIQSESKESRGSRRESGTERPACGDSGHPARRSICGAQRRRAGRPLSPQAGSAVPHCHPVLPLDSVFITPRARRRRGGEAGLYGTNRIANTLRLAAHALSRAQGLRAEYVRRFKGRLGKAEGTVVGAHKLARILWARIVHRQRYDEAKAFKTSAATRIKNLQHQAQTLGFKLVPA